MFYTYRKITYENYLLDKKTNVKPTFLMNWVLKIMKKCGHLFHDLYPMRIQYSVTSCKSNSQTSVSFVWRTKKCLFWVLLTIQSSNINININNSALFDVQYWGAYDVPGNTNFLHTLDFDKLTFGSLWRLNWNFQ